MAVVERRELVWSANDAIVSSRSRRSPAASVAVATALRDQTLTCAHCQESTVRFADWRTSGWCSCVVPPGMPVRYFCAKDECHQACVAAQKRGMRGEA
jgi:hypothetical protein